MVNVAGSGCAALGAACRRNEERQDWQKRNITAWLKEIDRAGLDAVNRSMRRGCGTTVKDYGHAATVEWRESGWAASPRNVESGSWPRSGSRTPQNLTVAYHAACSMQHGQKLIEPPKLLRDAGFVVKDVPGPSAALGRHLSGIAAHPVPPPA